MGRIAPFCPPGQCPDTPSASVGLAETASELPGQVRLPIDRADGSPASPPGGPDYVWGVDPSTKRIAIAWAGPERGVLSADFPKGLAHGARLATIHDRVMTLARQLREVRPPMYVLVEQPSGRYRNPQLLYAVGATQAALWAGLCDLFAHPVEVRTLPPRLWMHEVLGKGGAKKIELLAQARELGYAGADQDEADAWCIAEACRRLVRPS